LSDDQRARVPPHARTAHLTGANETLTGNLDARNFSVVFDTSPTIPVAARSIPTGMI
jgi:hypothetical protein